MSIRGESPDPQVGHSWTTVRSNVLRAALGHVTFPSGLTGMLQGAAPGESRIACAQGYVDQLSVALETVDARTLHQLLHEPEAFDLFQEGARHAVKSASNDRLRVIAELVANGLQENAEGRRQAKRLLSELSEIGDDRFATLRSHIRGLKDAYAARRSAPETAGSGESLFGDLAQAIRLARSTES